MESTSLGLMSLESILGDQCPEISVFGINVFGVNVFGINVFGINVFGINVFGANICSVLAVGLHSQQCACKTVDSALEHPLSG
jgi:hypothetical protein